jgi:protein tyrosine phosphatase (PTP) superfamily phosphohydrolase (DUF442 family)
MQTFKFYRAIAVNGRSFSPGDVAQVNEQELEFLNKKRAGLVVSNEPQKEKEAQPKKHKYYRKND